MKISLKELLFEKYLQYQNDAGVRKTLKQFAEHIGMGQVYLNQIMNERRSAGEKTINHLAEFFHDERFYDAVDMPRPDPRLMYVQRNWGRMSEEGKKRIADEAARYIPDEADQKK